MLLTVALAMPAVADSLLLTGARVLPAPGAEALDDASILVVDGKIAALSEGALERSEDQPPARTIDASGLVVVAGFWNCHVHFTESHWFGAAARPTAELESKLETMLTRHGFTSVVDTGSIAADTAALRTRIGAGLRGPSIRMASGSFVAVGGSPAYLEVGLPELRTPEQAQAVTEFLLGLGVEGVKIFTGSYLGPGRVAHLDLELVRAVTEAAHARGGFVIAHPQTRLGVELALEGGVDILAHTAPGDGLWPGQLIERLVAADVALVPTLKLWRWEFERGGVPADVVTTLERHGVGQLRAFAAAGGTVLFGTDVGYMTEDDPAEEYRLMQRAGLDADALLAALTTAPAARFGGGTTSTVEVGQPADLVLLGADPRHDPSAFSDVRATIRGGRVIFEAQDEQGSGAP
ncbi:MAG: amidohydrolase family protein [Acidobacteriota bacterium]